MTLHIIHLAHRKDRFDILKRELYSQGITDYKIWEGIIDPEIACRGISKAHKQIIRYAKEENLPEVLIAEDDIHFCSPSSFSFFLSKKPLTYDLYLGGIIWGKLNEGGIVDDFSGTTLYFANNKFYDPILSLPEEKDYDRALAKKGKFIVCNPMVVVQHNGYSDNQKRYINFEPYIKRRNLLK